MSNKDFQNGFALGLASGGVIIEQDLNPELIDEISGLIGSAPQYEVLWSATLNVPYNENTSTYEAPYTAEFPPVDETMKAYKFEINGDVVDGMGLRYNGETYIGAYSQSLGQQIGLYFRESDGVVVSYGSVPTNLEIKLLKTTETIPDYCVLIKSPTESNIEDIGITVNVPTSYGFTGGTLNVIITVPINDTSDNVTFSMSGDDYGGYISGYSSEDITSALDDIFKNNTPVTVTISQGDVTKVITDNYVAESGYVAYEENTYYRWGNGGYAIPS